MTGSNPGPRATRDRSTDLSSTAGHGPVARRLPFRSTARRGAPASPEERHMRLLSRAALRHTTGRSLIFVLLLSSAVAAQQPVGAISGTVRDSGGTPVMSVEVRGGTKTPVWTRTDSAGAYHLGGLPAGKTQVVFRRLGFEPVTKDVVVSERPQTVDVTMEMLPAEMAALITEASTRVREMLRDFWHRRE